VDAFDASFRWRKNSDGCFRSQFFFTLLRFAVSRKTQVDAFDASFRWRKNSKEEFSWELVWLV
jgi:hypothetical protein